MNALLRDYLKKARASSLSADSIRAATAETIAAELKVGAKRINPGMVAKIKRYALRQAEQDAGQAIADTVKIQLQKEFPAVACSYAKRRGQVCVEVWPDGVPPDAEEILAAERSVEEVRL